MNALKRKLSNLFTEFKTKNNGELPKYVTCTIRWHRNGVFNGGEYSQDVIFALYEYDIDTPQHIDNRVFFFVDKPDYMYKMLANIDFVREGFDTFDAFCDEVDKYDTNDHDSDDWTILHRGEDFCIVDIKDMFNEI